MDVTLDNIQSIEPKIIKAMTGGFWLKLKLFETEFKHTPICVFFKEGFDYKTTKQVFTDFAERFDVELDEFLEGGE